MPSGQAAGHLLAWAGRRGCGAFCFLLARGQAKNLSLSQRPILTPAPLSLSTPQPTPATTYHPAPFGLGGAPPHTTAAGLSAAALARGGGRGEAGAGPVPPTAPTSAPAPGGFGALPPPPMPDGAYDTPRHHFPSHAGPSQHTHTHPPATANPSSPPPAPDTAYDLANALLRDLHFERLRRVVAEGSGEGLDEG